MSYTSPTASQQLNHGFLLLVHLICADKQIHSEEIKYLNELGDRANISQQTKDEMEKILAQDDHHLTRDCILKRIKIEQRSLVMEQILNTFYEEGLFGLSEEEAISSIASICSWSPKGIKRIIKARGYQVASNYKISLATSPTSENGINYGFLLLVHLVCADQQIHSEESKYLRELSDRANISQQTKDEMEKILAQDNHHLTIDYITKQISVGQQSEVMRQILAIAYADNDFAPLEREMVDRIASIWNWSDTELERIIAEAESFSNQTDNYEDAIKQCAKIAIEDYQYAELAFNETEATLKTLIISLEEVISKIENKNSKAATAKEVAKQLEDSKQSLETEIIKKVAKVRESYQAKQRALNLTA